MLKHKYMVGDKVMVIRGSHPYIGSILPGPYTIIHVHPHDYLMYVMYIKYKGGRRQLLSFPEESIRLVQKRAYNDLRSFN